MLRDNCFIEGSEIRATSGFFGLSRVVHFLCLLLTVTACQTPDVPVGGTVVPFKKKYLFGDKVAYVCKKGFIRIGKETRICEFNGKWSEQTPFCDTPTKVKNPTSSSVSFSLHNANRAVDGDPTTCFTSKKGTGENFKIFLVDHAVVNIVRLYLPKGKIKIEVQLVRTGRKINCSHYERELEEDQWVLIQCESNQISDSIHIAETSAAQSTLEICELEIYVKEGSWCHDPPDVFIPNGWLQISREKSTLQCAEGFEAKGNPRLVCDKNEKWIGLLQCDEILCHFESFNLSTGGEWRVVGTRSGKISVGTSKRLTCNKGYKLIGAPDTVTCLVDGSWSASTADCVEIELKKQGYGIKSTIIIVSVLVVLLILTGFSLMLFLIMKKKSKPTVVILKTNDSEYAIQSCSSGGPVAYAESEYSTVAYETATYAPSPRPPLSRPPVNLMDGYSKPTDQWSLVDYGKEQAPPYAEPQDSFGMSENKTSVDVFDALKTSPLYSP